MPSLFVELVWKPLPESGDVDVNVFLKDVESLISLLDILGTQMKPVRNDMTGNVGKINDSHKKHSADKQWLHEVIEEEISLGVYKKDPSACVGLVWLKRGIEYFYEFLNIICTELKAGTLGDSMAEVARRAYDRTLKVHHNWFMNKTFSMVSHLSPKKATVMKNMTQDDPVLIASLPDDIQGFLDSVKPVVDKLNDLITKYELQKL